MRFLVRAPALATFLMLSGPAFAADQADLDRCKFVGELTKADAGISACDRIVSDSKVSTQDRANALSSRCGWWWAKKDADRALADCNESIRLYSSSAATYSAGSRTTSTTWPRACSRR